MNKVVNTYFLTCSNFLNMHQKGIFESIEVCMTPRRFSTILTSGCRYCKNVNDSDCVKPSCCSVQPLPILLA